MGTFEAGQDPLAHKCYLLCAVFSVILRDLFASLIPKIATEYLLGYNFYV